MTDVIVRPAAPTDLPVLSGFWYEKSIILAQQDRRWAVDAAARSHWEAQASGWLADPRCRMLVAEDEQRAYGYIIGWLQPAPAGLAAQTLGLITEMSLEMHHFQGGAGRALVAALRAWFEEQSVTQIIVCVPRRAAVDQAFWRSYGGAEWMDVLWLRS